jgi:hypothetical protein
MVVEDLLVSVLGEAQALRALASVARSADVRATESAAPDTPATPVLPAQLAEALGLALFVGLLDRVPSGASYVDAKVAAGEKVVFDHGALRTVLWPNNGALPEGRAAIARVLEPLGYVQRDVYPLPALRMTGYAYTHQQFPESLPQYFVSELHPEQFTNAFQDAVTTTLASSREPLSTFDKWLLAKLTTNGKLPFNEACAVLKAALGCFARQHSEPSLQAYETLKAESAEMAWIATEGNVFNHATDRVDDVVAVAEVQRKAGRSIKAFVEISASGRVRQTALLADKVRRSFVAADGTLVSREVPGSFYEFISRDCLPGSVNLDLAFDSGNATGIFKVTAEVAKAA